MPRHSEDEKSEEEEKADRYNIRTDDGENARVRTSFMTSERESFGSNNDIRATRWMAFAKQHGAFGFEKLSNADLPQMSHKAHGISVCFEKIRGWRVPKSLLGDLGKGNCEVTMHLSLSLFHMKSSTFFGTTWSSASVALNDTKISDTLDLDFPDTIHVISRIVDPMCVGIVEIVATRIEKTSELATARYGCGWAMLSLFDQRRLQDVSEGYNHVSATCATFYKGSPRDILELSLHNKILDSKVSLQEVSGCQLNFKIFANRRLLNMSSIITENAIYGKYDVIPGLEARQITVQGERKPKSLPCIGEHVMESKTDTPSSIPKYPALCRRYSSKLSNIQIYIPNRSSIESALIHDARLGIHDDASGRAQILSRVAKIGFHNGHTALNGSLMEYALDEDDADDNVLKIPTVSIELSDYIAHELVALVIIVEYSVGGPSSREATHSFKSIQYSSKNKGEDVSTVTLGAAVFVPMNDGRIYLRNEPAQADDESFDIELDVLTDEKCAVLTSSKMFKISDHIANADEDDMPKVEFDMKMYDWNGREIFHDHEDDQNFIITEAEDDTSVSSNEKTAFKRIKEERKIEEAYSDSESDSVRETVHNQKLRTSLKLDRKYYSSRKFEDTGEAQVRDVEVKSSSLLVRSMKLDLNTGRSRVGKEILDEKKARYTEDHVKICEQTRTLSRASRSRLSRHGFHATSSEVKTGYGGHIPTKGQEMMNVDVNLESRDPLSLHEIVIQFAGYRGGSPLNSGVIDTSTKKPRAICCSYQFYTCNHTRTEYMKILPSGVGEVGVLVRDDAHARNETPLALRHTVDCSDVSTLEAHHFANYLGRRMMYIDVWDADSHLLLGTCTVPLRKLMRQGQHSVKSVIECDLYNCETTPSNEGGISSMNIISCGPLIGTIVGSLNVIISNTGKRGHFQDPIAEPKGQFNSDLNWRLSTRSDNISTSRPKNQVRAKPLSESQPKLSRLLDDQRTHMGCSAPMRSMSITRADDSANTITYDELSRLFKRFQGTVKGTIQYSGALMNLLEVPSMKTANIKFMKAVKKLGYANLKAEISKFVDSNNSVGANSVKEIIHRVTTTAGVHLKSPEYDLLANRYSDGKDMHSSRFQRLVNNALNEYEWNLIAKRFTSAFQQATLAGTDFEQLFSEYDRKSEGMISVLDFENALQILSPFADFTSTEKNTIVRFFSHGINGEDTLSPHFISIKAIMSQVGKEYVGNLRSRLVKMLQSQSGENSFCILFFSALSAKGKSPTRDAVSVEDVEEAFQDSGVYREFTRSQVKPIITNIIEIHDGISGAAFLGELGFAEHEVRTDFDVESLLRVIISRVKEKGVDIEATFRHFDTDGNGILTKEELEEGLTKLQIFDSISDWKSQIPDMVDKFDSSRDGGMQIKEFLAYVGIDYAPNVIQKMTKIFANALEKSLSIEDIFQELSGGSKFITAQELLDGLKKFGTFDDISIADTTEILNVLGQENGVDDSISCDAFVNIFGNRTRQLKADKVRKKSEKLIQRFRNLMKRSVDKGLKPDDIFKHFDKDRGGTISGDEFISGIKSLPHFKYFEEEDIHGLVEVIDSDGSGDVSLEEFKQFIINASPKLEKDPLSDKSGGLKEMTSSSSNNRELFSRHMRRISEADGGLSGLLAFLDKEGNGLCPCDSFYLLLSREGVFDSLSKMDCEALLVPITKDGAIDLTLLMRFIEDDSYIPALTNNKEDDAEYDECYAFSENPEIRKTEKKLRSIGRIFARNGVNIEGLFKKCDSKCIGMIRRTDFIEILSKSGLYILERGNIADEKVVAESDDITRMQKLQVRKLLGKNSIKAANFAQKYVDHDTRANHEFQEHQESIALINWYRQGQKRDMLNQVLSYALSTSMKIYPCFGRTVFFEMPVRNPFDHEDFFSIEISDPELSVVSNYEEWVYLRQNVKSSGSIGDEPIDSDIFDVDGNGSTHFALLPHETFHLPFKFLSLTPTFASKANRPQTGLGSKGDGSSKDSSEESGNGLLRTAEIRIISGSRGHVVSIIKVKIFPRPFAINRTLHFYGEENSTLQKRINLLTSKGYESPSKYIHCVENGNENKVVLEYENLICNNNDTTEITVKYRCARFPAIGSFYVLIYDDQYQGDLADIWYIVVQSCLKIDAFTSVGSVSAVDLIVRGDSYKRRVRAYSSSPSTISFLPSTVMQMSSRVSNRIVVKYAPLAIGSNSILVNLVDVDDSNVLCSWILNAHATSPHVKKHYDVILSKNHGVHKMITFFNSFECERTFQLSSSDEMIMRPRDPDIIVPGNSAGIVRLYFASSKSLKSSAKASVYLFMNDTLGHIEETYQFNVSAVSR